MKVALLLLGLVALGSSAPQTRKVFHEHFEDFLDIIMEEAGDDLDHIFGHYLEYDEFRATMNYISTTSFSDLIYEMESLPEFKAVIEFLENDNIDILYFLDRFNEMIEHIEPVKSLRHDTSGTTLSAFIKDTITLLPKEKLAALFEQKKAEDEGFKTAVENLDTDEWHNIFGALWENEVFEKEVATLDANGVNVHALLNEIKAIFGQAE